jgi:NitT/TauT family transport system substrate-binding protein
VSSREPSARRVLLAILLIGMTGWSACKRESQQPSTRSNKLAPQEHEVRIAQWGQERYLIYLPLYVAIERQLFAKRGLDVALTFTGNDDQTFASVIGGNSDFGVGDPVFTAISQERGYPARVVATVVGGVAIWGLAKKPTVPVIERPADLAGLRVGTFPSPSTNYTLMKELIEQHPKELRNTRIVQAPIGSQIALLEAGSADIAMELEPAASIAESKGYRIVYSSPRFHGPFAFTGLTTTEKLIKEKPDLVAKVVAALQEAVELCHHDPEIAIAVGEKLFPTLPKEVAARAVRRMIDEKTLPDSVVVDDAAWQAALRTRVAVGDLKKPQRTDVAVDNSFALAAMHQSR